MFAALAVSCVTSSLQGFALEARTLLLESQESAVNTLSREEEARGFKLIFDGNSMNGWIGYRKTFLPKGWSAEDGSIHFHPGVQGGDIRSAEKFANFDFRFEWKASPGGNSGVFYRVTDELETAWFSGPEYQILDDTKHSDGQNPISRAAACYGMYPRSVDNCRPGGEWNQGRIVANGRNIQHWLNGVKVVEYTIGSKEWSHKANTGKFQDVPLYGRVPNGYIVLQDHGNDVWYRSLRIRKL